MPRTYIYTRVSTTRQGEGNSLESQAKLCFRFAEQHDLTIGSATNCDEPGVFIDARSAFRHPLSDRPGGQSMLSQLEPGDTIIMYDISRGWRSIANFATRAKRWIDAGISIRFVAYPSLDLTTANGRLTAHVLAAYAEWKSAISSERGREYRAAKKRRLIEEKPRRKRANPLKSTPESQAVLKVMYPEPIKEVKRPISQNIYGYVRVSTDEQSVESQIGPVQRHIDHVISSTKDLMIPGEIYEDNGVSALKVNMADRPKAAEMLSRVRSGDHVVILRPARAFRSVRDMVNTVDALHQAGVVIHIAEGGMKSGDLNFNLCMQIMVLMAQIESEENSRRVKDANQFLREQGLPPCTQQQNVGAWLKIIDIDDRHRALIPNESYIEICELVESLRSQGFTMMEACQHLEDIDSVREGRFRILASGMDPKVASRKIQAECSGSPFHRILRADFSKRIDEARAAGKLVVPRYSIGQVKAMESHLAKYRQYLAALNS